MLVVRGLLVLISLAIGTVCVSQGFRHAYESVTIGLLFLLFAFAVMVPGAGIFICLLAPCNGWFPG